MATMSFSAIFFGKIRDHGRVKVCTFYNLSKLQTLIFPKRHLQLLTFDLLTCRGREVGRGVA